MRGPDADGRRADDYEAEAESGKEMESAGRQRSAAKSKSFDRVHGAKVITIKGRGAGQ